MLAHEIASQYQAKTIPLIPALIPNMARRIDMLLTEFYINHLEQERHREDYRREEADRNRWPVSRSNRLTRDSQLYPYKKIPTMDMAPGP
jgi:hypothetical protein